MQLLKIIWFMILLVLLLITSTSAMVYDDEGNVITEDEIKKEINEMSTSGRHYIHYISASRCIGGSCVTIAPWLIGMSLYIPKEGYISLKERIIISAISIVGPILGIYIAFYGHYKGEKLDRQDAIERIKEQRRTQKQNEGKESLIPEHKIALPLLSGSF